MKTNHLLIVIGVIAALLLASCSSKAAPSTAVPEGAQAGELTGMQACEHQPAGSKTKYDAECGTLVVPENWDKASSRLIALPVVRIPASGSKPRRTRVLAGGRPGWIQPYLDAAGLAA